VIILCNANRFSSSVAFRNKIASLKKVIVRIDYLRRNVLLLIEHLLESSSRLMQQALAEPQSNLSLPQSQNPAVSTTSLLTNESVNSPAVSTTSPQPAVSHLAILRSEGFRALLPRVLNSPAVSTTSLLTNESVNSPAVSTTSLLTNESVNSPAGTNLQVIAAAILSSHASGGPAVSSVSDKPATKT
jgi:hypothetical protein